MGLPGPDCLRMRASISHGIAQAPAAKAERPRCANSASEAAHYLLLPSTTRDYGALWLLLDDLRVYRTNWFGSFSSLKLGFRAYHVLLLGGGGA